MSDAECENLSDDARLDWLRLIRSENVGPVTFRRLMDRFGSASAAIEALPALAARGGRHTYGVCSLADAERELQQLAKAGAHLIADAEPAYPALLKTISDAPPLISVKGDLRLLDAPAIGIVGARNASAKGRAFAHSLARDLGASQVRGKAPVIVSGLARGIDTAAHEGALDTGTIAVVAGGIDQVYPPENADLMQRISEAGVIVAEQRIGTEPRGRLFPLRNRLISGLSLGVVVVEASPKSGSLITARQALDQGREVFAVPGAPGDPRTAGANSLIRDGAWLTENAQDILEQLPEPGRITTSAQNLFEFKSIKEPESPGVVPDSAYGNVVELLGSSPVTVDELLRSCQLSLPNVSAVLLELELAGRLERLPGNRVQLLSMD